MPLNFLCYFSLLLWCILVALVSSDECVVPDSCTSTPAYYWRDYAGFVPPDAIKGGQDEAGNTTYIGQVLSPNTKGILPAIIYPGKREALGTAALQRFTNSKYVKILCGMEKHKFEWKSIKVQDMHLLTDFHLVVGGIESDLPLYVGRAFFEGELMIGKVFDNNYWGRGLRLPMKNGSEYGLLSYEVLLYPRQCMDYSNIKNVLQ